MTETSGRREESTVLDVVIELLETEGYDAVQLREVARRAHTSLSTIYSRHRTRDDLIVAAMQRWMERHRYAGLPPAATERAPRESIYDALIRVNRIIFEPWERHPRMLRAYHRARIGPGGERLVNQGMAAVVPATDAALAGVDPVYIEDIRQIMWNVVYALMGRFTDGEIAITEILPSIERTVYRLTAGYEGAGAPPATRPQSNAPTESS